MDHQAGRLHRARGDPEERRLPQGDALQRAVRRLDRLDARHSLLSETQKYVGQALDGQMDPMAAMQKLAEEKERILREKGLLK